MRKEVLGVTNTCSWLLNVERWWGYCLLMSKKKYFVGWWGGERFDWQKMWVFGTCEGIKHGKQIRIKIMKIVVSAMVVIWCHFKDFCGGIEQKSNLGLPSEEGIWLQAWCSQGKHREYMFYLTLLVLREQEKQAHWVICEVNKCIFVLSFFCENHNGTILNKKSSSLSFIVRWVYLE